MVQPFQRYNNKWISLEFWNYFDQNKKRGIQGRRCTLKVYSKDHIGRSVGSVFQICSIFLNLPIPINLQLSMYCSSFHSPLYFLAQPAQGNHACAVSQTSVQGEHAQRTPHYFCAGLPSSPDLSKRLSAVPAPARCNLWECLLYGTTAQDLGQLSVRDAWGECGEKIIGWG